MLESIFSFLFKYRPAVYQRGQLGFESQLSLAIVALGVAVLLLVVLLTYRRTRHRVRRRDFFLLTGLRAAALGLLVFALLRPVMVVATVVPQENILAVVLDDSRSMQLADQGGEPRSDFVTNTFASEESLLLDALGERRAFCPPILPFWAGCRAARREPAARIRRNPHQPEPGPSRCSPRTHRRPASRGHLGHRRSRQRQSGTHRATARLEWDATSCPATSRSVESRRLSRSSKDRRSWSM